jgi:flagellar biosynthesis/type III secretory pathway protein FliH
VTDPTLVFTGEGRTGRRLVVNFGVYSGREATEAEIYRLAKSLLEELGSVEIVAERRFEFASDVEATVHQVYVELPRAAERQEQRLSALVEEWAEDVIGKRRRIAP